MPRARRLLLGALLSAAAGGALGAAARADEPPLAPRVAPEVAALRDWLRDEAWAVRSLAAWDLRRRTEDGAAFVLTEALRAEADVVVLDCALAALADRPREELVRDGGPDLVEATLTLARHPNARVRARALAILERLPPVRLARSLEDVRGWWARGRELHAREQQALLRRAEEARRAAPSRLPLAPGETPSVAPEAAEGPAPYAYVRDLVRGGLEVCIVMDHTGSMGAVIAQAKASAVALLRRLGEVVPRVRVGLVTYDDGPALRTALTQDEEAWLAAFDKVAAAGGGDLEEGVDKGIRLALRQERMGWSRGGRRVLVVIGDAPPHEGDVPGLLAALRRARADEMYDHPVVVHTVSTDLGGVDHFDRIAAAGGGRAVTLGDTSRLLEELLLLAFGGAAPARLRPWLEEVDLALQGAAP